MIKEGLIFIFLIFCFLLAGCATTSKQDDLEAQGLRNQITVLETQLQSKDEEIKALKDSLASSTAEKQLLPMPIALEAPGQEAATGKITDRERFRPTSRQIQAALKNAGYQPGPIDGKIGKQTKEAIKAFQQANKLEVDGKVGQSTWNLLKDYL